MTTPTSKPSIANWAGWAVAAILAVVASYFAAMSFGTRAQLLVQKDQADLNALELRSLHQSIEANRILHDRQVEDLQQGNSLSELKVAALSTTGRDETIALAVWNPAKQEGLLSSRKLPKVAADQNYQLWLMDAAHNLRVSAGVFSCDEQGRVNFAFHPTQAIEPKELILTVEPKAGSSFPTGARVASGTF